MSRHFLARAQANFWAGLAIVLPGVVSIAVLVWFFGSVAGITDTLLSVAEGLKYVVSLGSIQPESDAIAQSPIAILPEAPKTAGL